MISSIHGLPDNPCFLIVQINDHTIRSVRNSLLYCTILFNDQGTFQIMHLSLHQICMADITHSFQTFSGHLFLCTELLINHLQRFRNMTLHKLFPCKRHHLLPVADIQITGILFISDQIRIKQCCFFIIQCVTMHKIQKDRLRQCFSHIIFFNRRHIILIKLCNLKSFINRSLIPYKIMVIQLIALDEQRTDCIQDHRFCIKLI